MFAQLEGTLMDMSESPDARFVYTIWFDYTRESINAIQEGTMLAVPNFGADEKINRMSVLEVTSVKPSHFGLQGGIGGYPGFVVEAARSAAQDWESQESVSTEETTKIVAVAIPTGLEIVEPEFSIRSDDFQVEPETNMAMVGSRVHALDSKTTNRIANNGIDQESEMNLAVIGTLARNHDVEIIARVDDMLRTHFAIFGFTGVGKSNLLSTAVSKIFESSQDPVKIVFFDLMGEYTGLMIDQLLAKEINGNMLAIGRHTLPEGVFKRINGLGGAPRDEEAAKQLMRYSLLPKALQKYRGHMESALLDIVRNAKLRYFNEAQSTTVYDLMFTSSVVEWAKIRYQPRWGARQDLVKRALREAKIGMDYKIPITPDLARKIRDKLENILNEPQFNEFKRDGDFANHIDKLEELERSTAEVLAAGTTLTEIVDDLNNDSSHSLWVIQAHKSDDLRNFSRQLGEELYESRRLNGVIDPLVSFIFDEADEFIRRDGKGSYEASAEIAETIARRGRKFGIGIGIATQRIRYLDTNIMAQPHTYFVSKLPRASDRDAVAEAFGFGNDMLSQTFKFTKGQWLLVSHDATGLDAVPLPVKTDDANVRVAAFLKEKYPVAQRLGLKAPRTA